MAQEHGLLRHVNTLQGTDSHYGMSMGNTLPLVAVPFGMNHWSPQTREGRWFFDPRERKIQGVRATHQPSPWMGDYGAIVIMAQMGARKLSPGDRASAYRLDTSVLKPNHFKTKLIRYRTTLEMAPTERCSIFRFTFPDSAESRVIIEPAEGDGWVCVAEDRRSVSGYTRGSSGGTPEGFAHYYFAEFDRPATSFAVFDASEPTVGSALSGIRAGAALDFTTTAEDPVVMRLGTSFIGVDQARLNLQREIGDSGLEDVSEAAAKTWEETLAKIVLESEDAEELRTFYSCLYRTQLFPRVWHEADAEGAVRHFSPYDGQVHDGVLYADNGFWDTYRTVYPLFSLLNRERLPEILQGWVNALKEGGWFPQWASPGYRACMVGTHIDAVVADAVARGVREFDVESALDGMLRHADEIGDPNGAFGRIGIEDYKQLGYVACDRHHEACARSLDYAYDDFCIAQVAHALGRHDDAERLMSRVRNYEKSYDQTVGFMRGRTGDGSWLEPWNEFRWGNPYVEGGPWQSSWAVQHDITGLIKLMGGEQVFVAKLDQMLAMDPDFEVGAYGFEIHEITEMACADFGQYAHSNQPVHHVLYLYNAAGRPWRTQKEVRRVLSSLYSPTLLPGDEDNGEMSAWYVLSALGFFPLCPGHGSWTFGSPLFRKATFRMPNGKDLVITAQNNSADNVYVRSVRFNGQLVEGLSIDHTTLAEGGVLEFEMSREPLEKIVPPELRPFSIPRDS